MDTWHIVVKYDFRNTSPIILFVHNTAKVYIWVWWDITPFQKYLGPWIFVRVTTTANLKANKIVLL